MSKYFRKATLEEEAAIAAKNKADRERYAMNMFQLQSKAGLSFREATAFLIEYVAHECDLADEWNVSLQAVYNLQRRASKKIEKCGKTLDEIYGRYKPTKCPTILIDRLEE